MKIIYFYFINIVSSLLNPFISIQPGGLTGFYTLGICSYMKENYDLSQYNVMGSSSGAWNALYLVNNDDDFIMKLLKQDFCHHSENIHELQENMKQYLLNTYKDEDFDLDRLYICTSSYHKVYFKSRVNHHFRTLEDAIDCCISSSHIPLITSNNFWNTYREQTMFDGGLFNLPDFVYGEYIKHQIIINPYIFHSKLFKNFFSNMIKYNIQNLTSFYIFGFDDSRQNKECLDFYLNT